MRKKAGGWGWGTLVAVLFLCLANPAHAQWEIEESHTHASLRGIHSLGGGVAWTSGTDGTVLRTEDGGYLWQGCAIPPGAEKLDFRGVQAFDEQTAIVMSSGPGDQSRLYKTTDGCRSWKLVFTNPDKDGFWDAIILVPGTSAASPQSTRSSSRGFLLGDPVDGNFVLYRTDDAGQTWRRWANSRSERPVRARQGESLFAASNSAAIALGESGFAFATGGPGGSHFFLLEQYSVLARNRWLSFARSDLPLATGNSSGAFSLAARPVEYPARGVADLMIVGGDYSHPEGAGAAIFLPARKLCCSWLVSQSLRKAQTPPHGYRSAVAFDRTHKTWITVGPNGTDISRDDGKSWTALKPTGDEPKDADQHWNALSLPFAVGPDGRIGKLRADALDSRKGTAGH